MQGPIYIDYLLLFPPFDFTSYAENVDNACTYTSFVIRYVVGEKKMETKPFCRVEHLEPMSGGIGLRIFREEGTRCTAGYKPGPRMHRTNNFDGASFA